MFQSQISSQYSPNKGLNIPNPQSLMFLPFLEQLRGIPPGPSGVSVNLPQLSHSTPPVSKAVATPLTSSVSICKSSSVAWRSTFNCMQTETCQLWAANIQTTSPKWYFPLRLPSCVSISWFHMHATCSAYFIHFYLISSTVSTLYWIRYGQAYNLMLSSF